MPMMPLIKKEEVWIGEIACTREAFFPLPCFYWPIWNHERGRGRYAIEALGKDIYSGIGQSIWKPTKAKVAGSRLIDFVRGEFP